MPHSHYQWSARDLQSREGQEVNGAAFAEGDVHWLVLREARVSSRRESKGHTGSSDRRNTEVGADTAFSVSTIRQNKKMWTLVTFFSSLTIKKKKKTQVFFNCEIGPKFQLEI